VVKLEKGEAIDNLAVQGLVVPLCRLFEFCPQAFPHADVDLDVIGGFALCHSKLIQRHEMSY
jgi:hypothetical protein